MFQLLQSGCLTLDHLVFCERHYAYSLSFLSFISTFQVLDAFGKRYATATTGGLLNTLAERSKGNARAIVLGVKLYRSGLEGGDAQVAELIVDRGCRRVLFLEYPDVARQNEADIQLLVRTARSLTDFASCMSDAKSADRWLTLIKARQI